MAMPWPHLATQALTRQLAAQHLSLSAYVLHTQLGSARLHTWRHASL